MGVVNGVRRWRTVALLGVETTDNRTIVELDVDETKRYPVSSTDVIMPSSSSRGAVSYESTITMRAESASARVVGNEVQALVCDEWMPVTISVQCDDIDCDTTQLSDLADPPYRMTMRRAKLIGLARNAGPNAWAELATVT